MPMILREEMPASISSIITGLSSEWNQHRNGTFQTKNGTASKRGEKLRYLLHETMTSLVGDAAVANEVLTQELPSVPTAFPCQSLPSNLILESSHDSSNEENHTGRQNGS